MDLVCALTFVSLPAMTMSAMKIISWVAIARLWVFVFYWGYGRIAKFLGIWSIDCGVLFVMFVAASLVTHEGQTHGDRDV